MALAFVGGSGCEALELTSGEENGWALRARPAHRPVLERRTSDGLLVLRLQGLPMDATAAANQSVSFLRLRSSMALVSAAFAANTASLSRFDLRLWI